MAKFVSKFTGQEIDNRLEAVSAKFGAFHIDPSTMTFYYFKDHEDKQKFLDGDTSVVLDSEKFDVSNKIQQIKIVNDMGSTILYFTTQEESNIITVGFLSQEKDFGDDEFTEVYENAYFTVDVDKSNKGEWVTIVENQRVVNGEKLSVDVKNYLATGPNKVRIKCTGEQSEKSTTMLFTANVTTMYLKASNFGWHLPFIEGNPFKLGGMLIGGSIDKVLNIRISNENNYAASYKVPLGTATHTINPYDYHDLPFPTEGGTGIYHVELWLDANGLESDHLKYNIMCVAAADQHTAQLVVMNSSLSQVVNYAENTVFEYSCYNAGGTTATPHLKLQSIIGTVPTVLVEGTLGTVETAKAQSYTYQPEIESWEEGMQLQAILTNGNEQTIIFPVDNSLSFPAISGASFYLQPSSRNNTQDDREMIINKADHSYWQAYWENMAWKDGIDGWTTDASGTKCLFLPAGSTAEVQMQPMKSLTNKTIDLVFKVNHVSDYDTPVFSICDDPSSDSFNGIVVYPNRVVVYTNDQKSTLVQSRNFREGVRQSMQIVYANNYKGVGNTVTIYQNGVAQCEFQYETKDLVTNDGYIRMGNAFSDFYLYSMRVYERALAWPDCAQNWFASLRTTEEKQAAMENLMKCVDDSFNMSFDAVVAAGFNYMTIEMTEGKIPSYVSQAAGKCNVELKVKGWWDTVTKFLDILIEGQGTTAMNYWLWNLRLKLAILAFFAGKWTGKINFASGMQNHKMSATDMYNELYHAVGLENEVNGPVAVKQQPIFAFEKKLVDASTGLYSYEFIGLYTFGPDKGNDAYFKFDDERFADKVIYLEGMDHNVKGAGYDYPYDKLSYKASAEAICNNGGEAALEVRKCGNAETEAEIQARLDEKFKPLYEFAYSNNPLIKGTDATLEQMNADVEAWGKQTDAEGHKFERFEFWIDGVYDVLYLDKAENRYMSNGTNLLTQLGLTEDDLAGLTIEEKNKVFIDARVARFKASAADYLDVNDYMFKVVFCIIFFASDNGIKNTYTYILAEKWRQLQDDLDSIFKSDNQSLFSKEFWQEMFDFANKNKSSYAFKGEHNVLEQLLRRAFPEVEKEMAHKILDAMVSLSPYGDNTIDKLMGYLQSRSWDRAQGYFPKSAYNNFTALAYEGAWPAYIGKSTVSYTVDVNPLSQIVGDSLETEMDFMYFRLIYIMSKYAYGPFANYDDKCLGQITWRTQASQSLTLTPAFPLYPAALSGQTGKRNADRRYMAGESITFDGLGGSNTNVYIPGADCLEDVGDLSDIIVDSETDATLQISAKRLKNLKVGDEVEASSNIGRLMLTSTPSLETLDARNLKNLASDVDLSNSPRLMEALLAGSVSTGVSLKRGQKIKVLSLPATITSLELLDLPNLTDENLTLEGVGNVTFLRLENCMGVDMFQLLKGIYNTEGNAIRDIRIIGFDVNGDSSDVTMIANLAKDVDKDGNPHTYNGIDAEGKPMDNSHPIIEGRLRINGHIYEEEYLALKDVFANLAMEFLGFYFTFIDPEINAAMVTGGVGDGYGITKEDITSLDSLDNIFAGNTSIQYFPEFKEFTGITYLSNPNKSATKKMSFSGCESLKEVSIPANLTILNDGALSMQMGAFFNCLSLVSVGDTSHLVKVGDYSFYNCVAYAQDVYLPSLEGTLGKQAYYSTAIKKVLNLGNVEIIDGNSSASVTAPVGSFAYCESLREVNLPESITEIRKGAFGFCTALNKVIIVATTPPALDANAFYGSNSAFVIQVPANSVEAYKTATNWSAYADRIIPISSLIASLFTFRRSGGGIIADGMARIETIRGNSLVWNQQLSLTDKTLNAYGMTATIKDGVVTISGQNNGEEASVFILKIIENSTRFNGHKMLLMAIGVAEGATWVKYGLYIIPFTSGGGTAMVVNGKSKFFTWNTSNDVVQLLYTIWSGVAHTDCTFRPALFDLTQMFGAGNEPTTLEEFYERKPLGIDEYAYNEGEVIHMNAHNLVSVGVNQWDEEWENGRFASADASPVNSTSAIRSVNYFNVIPNTAYHATYPGTALYIFWYDSEFKYIRNDGMYPGSPRTSPANAAYAKFYTDSTSYNSDICINLSDPTINGKYFAHVNGGKDLGVISKYFPDGMKSAGSVHDEIRYNDDMQKWEAVKRIGAATFDASQKYTTYNDNTFTLSLPDMLRPNTVADRVSNLLCQKYGMSTISNVGEMDDKSIIRMPDGAVYIRDTSYTDVATFKAAMAGVMLYYELAEPIITELDAEDQSLNLDYNVWNNGTERVEAEDNSAPFNADILYGVDM